MRRSPTRSWDSLSASSLFGPLVIMGSICLYGRFPCESSNNLTASRVSTARVCIHARTYGCAHGAGPSHCSVPFKPPTGEQLFRQSERELDVLRGGCEHVCDMCIAMSDCADTGQAC